MNDVPSPAELDALRLSLEVAVRSVGFSLPLAVLVAWILTRARFPGRMLFDAFVHLPLVLPPVAVGYVLLVLFGARGPIGAWLRSHFGIELAFTTAGAALATAVMTFPLMVRAIRLSLENVDRGLEEAARTLGAAPLDRFVSITLPLMLPGILAGPSRPWPPAWASSARSSPSPLTFPARPARCRSRSTPRCSHPAGCAGAAARVAVVCTRPAGTAGLRAAGAARAPPARPLACCRSRC